MPSRSTAGQEFRASDRSDVQQRYADRYLHTLIDDDLVPRTTHGTDRTLVVKFSRLFDVLN
mgnify:CR=1 FL=1